MLLTNRFLRPNDLVTEKYIAHFLKNKNINFVEDPRFHTYVKCKKESITYVREEFGDNALIDTVTQTVPVRWFKTDKFHDHRSLDHLNQFATPKIRNELEPFYLYTTSSTKSNLNVLGPTPGYPPTLKPSFVVIKSHEYGYNEMLSNPSPHKYTYTYPTKYRLFNSFFDNPKIKFDDCTVLPLFDPLLINSDRHYKILKALNPLNIQGFLDKIQNEGVDPIIFKENYFLYELVYDKTLIRYMAEKGKKFDIHVLEQFMLELDVSLTTGLTATELTTLTL